MRWLARTIVQRHGARRASRPQLKRDPLGISNPLFMSDTSIKTLFSNDRLKKVEFFRRADGSFGFEEWRFRSAEGAWAPFGRRSLAICDSLDKAEVEARGRVEWLGGGGADA